MQEKNNLNMNEDQRQLLLLPGDSAPTAAAAEAEDFTRNSALSTPQDRAAEDDAPVLEEGSLPASIGDDDYYDEKISIGDDDEDDIDIRNEIKRLHSEDTTMTQSTSDREFTKRDLAEDTFSFLIYANVPCFLCGILVFLFQMAIYVVLADDIINVDNKKNPFGFPFNVSIPVRISEFLAILISIIAQEDVRKAICLYRDGFDEGGLSTVFPGATLWKWTLSIVLRASEGLLGLVITFLLIMRSSSVLDLLLNFSAIEFVTKLDNVVFELAKEGFLGHTLKKETQKLCRKSYYVNIQYANSYNAMWVSLGYFVLLFASFFAGWWIIRSKQNDGEYLCHQIFSQFGDEILPMLGTFTGLFYKHEKQKFGDRASYRGTDVSDQEKGPLLAYCEDETRWTLSLTEDGGVWNPCKWLAASSESESFDLLSTTSAPWVMNTPSNRAAPLTHHFLMCHECENLDIPEKNGICKKALKPEKFDQCMCNDGYYGLRCEYSEPCQIVEVNRRDEGFAKEGGGQFTSKYYRLENVDTYYHPVYTSLGGNESLTNGTDFVFFTGERWIMSYKYLFPDLENVTDKDELAPFFRKFHGHFTTYSAVYESEPVYIDKLLSADRKASPLSIRWRPSSSDTASIQRLHTGFHKDFIETELSCAVCSEGNPCLDGVCLNGTCDECPDGYSGSRCEIPPKSLSNGHCDPKYNNNSIKFEFDGGDCCDNTCKSTLENTCGKTGLGYIDTGYSSCVRAYNQWDLSAEQVKGVSSASQSGQAVALSGNGKILAVADPGLSIVRLFDKDGAEWKQRGQNIQGPLYSHFGSVIGLSEESFNIASNPRTFPTVTLVVGAPKIGLVRVFTCSKDGCIQRGEDIIGSGRFGNSLSIDGDNIAIGGAARETVSRRAATNGEVAVFTWSNDTWEQKGSVAIATPSSRTLSESPHQFRLEGYYVSLSGDYLAVGTLEGKVLPGPRFQSAKLITQVFKWNNSTGWKEIRKTIYEETPFGNSWPLKSVVMKGGILAVGFNSPAEVYSWNETSQEWNPRQVELAKGPEGFLGWSVDLSEDASILAVGTSVKNPLPTDEAIRMYKWNGTHYNALFNGVPSGPAASWSLSSDGNAVAVGLPFDSSNGGSTRVYKFSPESPCDDKSKIPVRISFTTDGNPQETSWELRVDSEVKLSSGSLSGYKYTTFVEEICVKAEACVRFLAVDTAGDGLDPPGVYALMLNGTEVASGGDFVFFESYSTANCEGEPTTPPTSSPTQGPPQAPTSLPTKASTTSTTSSPTKGPTPTIVPAPTSSPTKAPSAQPTSSPTKVPTPEPTIAPIPAPTSSPTNAPTTPPPTSSPTKGQRIQPPSASPVKQCEGESKLVRIEITLGEKPWSSYWQLTTQQGAKIIFDGPYQVKGEQIIQEVCKPVSACYKFRLESTDDASALIFLDGKEIGTATTKNIIQIGDSACTAI
mmetsp:Transcript_29784/g.50793  ORF Transcript_29784/g.50793 Transcript_29784/m.50793 type:complete len:1440 (-) Transcript_29784:34-4353(-)